MTTNADIWYAEFIRAFKRYPHAPRQCVSIASSSPMATWYCRRCHQTYLALRDKPPTCEGGKPSAGWAAEGFGSRESNLAGLELVMRYSRETGTRSSISYHYRWLEHSGNGAGP